MTTQVIKTPLTMGEFFCGPGGIAYGASLAGEGLELKIEPTWATDYHKDTCKTYAYNIHNTSFEDPLPDSVIHTDIREIDIGSFPRCNIFSFGFPCNDFSLIGKSRGLDGEFGPLYQYGVEYLKLRKPEFFFAENVSGLSSANEGQAFEQILNHLGKVGYKLYPHKYKFEHYKVPQRRHRIIIIGIRDDLQLDFEIPATSDPMISSKVALMTPPINPSVSGQERINHSKEVIERLRYIKAGQNAWNADIPERLKLNVKGATLSNIYRRLDPDQPSYTVTGSGGGGTHMYHWEEDRALTNRERARLQTFPDEYEFYGPRDSVRRQIGMAVPPDGAKIILRSLLMRCLNLPYKSVQSNMPLQQSLQFPSH